MTLKVEVVDLLFEGALIVRELKDITQHRVYYDHMKKFCTLNNCKDSIEYDIKGLSDESKKIMEAIKRQGILQIDEICDNTDMDIKIVNSIINELLLKDLVVEMNNKMYSIN